MATLTLTVGQLTASYTATDASAAKALVNYAAAYGLDTTPVEYDADGNPLPVTPMTQQEKLQAVVNHLAQHIGEVSHGHQRRAAREAAEEAADTTPEKLEPSA